jgi:GcrA cell cycle regulator
MSHNNQSYNGWTQDREDLLKKLYLEGLSASAIAARISCTGFSVTRNAIIGKAHRMALNGHQPRTSRGTRIRKRKPKAQKPPHYGEQRKSAKLFLEAEPFTPGPELIVPENERRGIDGLTQEQCRWPIGDPQEKDFHFCNGSKFAGLPYCAHHAQRAYQPPEIRKKRIPVHYMNSTSVNDITRGVEALQNGDAPINTREKQDA